MWHVMNVANTWKSHYYTIALVAIKWIAYLAGIVLLLAYVIWMLARQTKSVNTYLNCDERTCVLINTKPLPTTNPTLPFPMRKPIIKCWNRYHLFCDKRNIRTLHFGMIETQKILFTYLNFDVSMCKYGFECMSLHHMRL